MWKPKAYFATSRVQRKAEGNLMRSEKLACPKSLVRSTKREGPMDSLHLSGDGNVGGTTLVAAGLEERSRE